MSRKLVVVLVVFGMLLVTSFSLAKMKKSGSWPEHDKKVSLDATRLSRSDAVKKLADEAGWNVVISGPAGEPVDVHVKDLEADKVLAVLLRDGDFEVDRDGTLVTVSPAKGDDDDDDEDQDAAHVATPSPSPSAIVAAPPSPSIAAPTTMPDDKGEDRSVHGGSLTVGPDEVVHDLSVMGGHVDVEGIVTGNLTVMGGSVKVKKGGHVFGNATTMGGSVEIEDGGVVDGRLGSLGGSIKRSGKVVSSGSTLGSKDNPKSLFQRMSDAVTASAMLFVFGAVLLALADRKMEAFRVEIASRPMRTFALGIVGILGGALAVAALAITVVGIPVAIVFAIVAVFAAYAGICSVLGTVGKALIGHKTQSPYVHLAFGCLLFLVSGAIPWVDGLVTFVVAMMGVGVVVATRGAGMWPGKNGKHAPDSGSPYRTAMP